MGTVTCFSLLIQPQMFASILLPWPAENQRLNHTCLRRTKCLRWWSSFLSLLLIVISILILIPDDVSEAEPGRITRGSRAGDGVSTVKDPLEMLSFLLGLPRLTQNKKSTTTKGFQGKLLRNNICSQRKREIMVCSGGDDSITNHIIFLSFNESLPNQHLSRDQTNYKDMSKREHTSSARVLTAFLSLFSKSLFILLFFSCCHSSSSHSANNLYLQLILYHSPPAVEMHPLVWAITLHSYQVSLWNHESEATAWYFNPDLTWSDVSSLL